MNVDLLFLTIQSFYKFPESLKSHQKEVIEFILAGKNDMIVVMPTGYGKSLLYTLPPLLLDEVRTSARLSVPYRLVTRKRKGVETQNLV